MKKLLDLFYEHVNTLTDAASGYNNVIITGSSALIEYGLDLDREVGDFDVVVYKPINAQMDYLNKLMKESAWTNTGSPEGNVDGKKSLGCLNVGGTLINFLVSEQSTPDSSLYYKYKDRFYRLQSIRDIISAKRSYFYFSETKGGYVRKKEALDFQNLKTLNFNL